MCWQAAFYPVKVYTASVQGCNLILNRWASGKDQVTAAQRSAMLRESLGRWQLPCIIIKVWLSKQAAVSWHASRVEATME